MKKATLLNSTLSYEIAKLGHTQTLCIGDAGLPVPPGPERIDLAVTKGVPGFLQVLDAVLSEMQAAILERFDGIEVRYVPHEQFKQLSAESRAVVRTGETTPYANILLRSGVTF